MQSLRFVLVWIRVAMARHQSANRFCKLWQFIEDTDRPQPLLVVKRGGPANHGACGDVTVRTTLGSYDDAISDIAVSRDAHLPSQNDILADNRRACQPDL